MEFNKLKAQATMESKVVSPLVQSKIDELDFKMLNQTSKNEEEEKKED
jgi:hypothetical protein